MSLHLSRIAVDLADEGGEPALVIEVSCIECGPQRWSVPVWHISTLAGVFASVARDLNIPVQTAQARAPSPEKLQQLKAWLDEVAPGWNTEEKPH